MSRKPNFDIDYQCITDIFACRTIDETKAATEAFLAAADKIRNIFDGMYVYMLCQRFEETFVAWSKQYVALNKVAKWNAVIVPPEHSPIMLLAAHVPFGNPPIDILAGLEAFVDRCEEFTPPKFDALTSTEIKRVLTAAQKAYGLIDIIAPKDPLKILRFANSHVECNSQCGIPVDLSRSATIFLFHPREDDLCDRFYIFAHELGHALHFALTRDKTILPDGFDEFNESLRVPLDTLKEKQEAFADATALAILHIRGLGTHFPTQYSKHMAPHFAQYIQQVTADAKEVSSA